MDKSNTLEFTKNIARVAGDILLKYFRTGATIQTKSNPYDLVTIADQESENYLVNAIANKFPTHHIIAEESALNLQIPTNNYTWIIDPLDGTTNYNHGIAHFAVSIALYYGDTGILAVTYNPVTGEMFSATQDAPAYLNDQIIKTTNTADFTQAMLATGLPYDRTSPEFAYTYKIMEQYNLTARGIRRFGAATLDMAFVAAGRLDAFFEYMLKPWDTAAGKILITQAGGRILTDNKLIKVDNGKLEWPATTMS